MTSPNSPAKYDGGPAFPMPSVGTGDPRDGMSMGSQGMTLRDYFAAKALPFLQREFTDQAQCYAENVARAAYEMADAMLAARDIQLKEGK